MQTALTIALQVSVIALLLFGSRRMPAGTWNEDYLSLSQTKGLQGMLALFIVFHHCGQKVMYAYLFHGLGFTSGLTLISLIGFMFVGYFLFCSGFGLYRSNHDKKAYLSGFLRHRPLPLLAIFYACNTLYLAGRLAFGETFDVPRLVRLSLGIELANPNSWYAVALPLLYVLFYLSARNSPDDGQVVRRLFVGTGAYMLVGTVATTALSGGGFLAFAGVWWYDSAILFPMGYLYGLKGDAVAGWMRRNFKKSVVVSLALCLGGFVPSVFLSFMALPETASAPVRFLVSLAIVATHSIAATGFVWAMLALSLKRRIQGRVLAFFGSITLELYLMHGFFVQLFHPAFYDMGTGVFQIGYTPDYILVVLALGTVVALLFRLLTKRLLGHR